MSLVTTIRLYAESLVTRVHHPVSTLVFTRLLAGYVLLKLLWQWPMRLHVHEFHRLWVAQGTLSGPLMYPARLARDHPDLFSIVAVLFLLLHLIVRRNHLTALLFSWLVFNLFVVNRPAGDGGDLVAFTFSAWAIFLVPVSSGWGWMTLTTTVAHNVARIGCMLQFVFLYAASGIDKLGSNVWVTGRAFAHMRAVGGIMDPAFPLWLGGPVWDMLFTWTSILLEVSFGILVWFRRWQPMLLGMAVVFHLGIWWMLGLADFSLIMIVGLAIFLRDDQYFRLFRPGLLST